MSDNVKIEEAQGFLQVILNEKVVEISMLYLLFDALVRRKQSAHNQRLLVLIEAPSLSKRIGIVDVYEMCHRAYMCGAGGLKIAYVVIGQVLNPSTINAMELFAQNRGIFFQFFRDRRSALNWLLPNRVKGEK